MQRTYSTKIVSLHLEPCEHGCPNENVCYLRKRKAGNGHPLPPSFKDDLLEQGFTVYDALCRPMNEEDMRRLRCYDNYNVTISCTDFENSNYEGPYKGLQISVYGPVSSERVPDGALKLFLIKDSETKSLAEDLYSTEMRNIHFGIDGFKARHLLPIFMWDADRNVSVDSCLTSWMVNGECPYTTDYIDISHDWTIRRCPFAEEGVPIPEGFITNKNYIDLFGLAKEWPSCSYKEVFNKSDGKQQYSSIQHYSSDNEIRADSACMR